MRNKNNRKKIETQSTRVIKVKAICCGSNIKLVQDKNHSVVVFVGRLSKLNDFLDREKADSNTTYKIVKVINVNHKCFHTWPRKPKTPVQANKEKTRYNEFGWKLGYTNGFGIKDLNNILVLEVVFNQTNQVWEYTGEILFSGTLKESYSYFRSFPNGKPWQTIKVFEIHPFSLYDEYQCSCENYVGDLSDGQFEFAAQLLEKYEHNPRLFKQELSSYLKTQPSTK